MDNENKLKLDDITFDDFIGEGLGVEEPKQEVKEEVKKDDAIEEVSDELDQDADEKVEEEKEEVAKPKSKKSEPAPEVEEEEEEEVEDTVVNEVLTQLGYEFPDEEFEDTSDGLVKLAKAVGDKMAEDQLDALFQAHPEIQKHLDYVLNGGKSEDWMKMSNQITDFENIKVTEDDLRTQRAVLGEYFKLKGHDDEFINELLDDYTDSNKLFDKAKKAKTALSDYYGKQRERATEKERKEQLAMQQKQREFWDDINDTIQNSKDFAGLTVQERDKKKFFDFLTKPDAEGRTAREKAHKESSTEVKLAIDYLMFKGFNLKDIIATKAKTASAKSLRKKIKSNSTTKSASRPKRKGGFDIESLDLNLSNL
tara:strand:+ start:6140 stop:7240 length:1101 start_codon:yes stop_codon:yes gene_type:complete